MKLLTKAQREQLLDNGRRQAAVKGTPAEIDFFPVVKLFNPCGAATWLLTEIDPDDETVVLVDNVWEGKFAVMPLFVAITEDMDIAFEGEGGSGDGEGGGPRRGFDAAKDITRPSFDVS